jgi:hypothetical protein
VYVSLSASSLSSPRVGQPSKARNHMGLHEPPAEPSGVDPVPPRRPWVTPAVTELPRLTELTLDTGSPIDGGGDTGGGGSTVF